MITSLLAPLIGPIVDRFLGLIPEPSKRAEAKEQLEKELVSVVNDVALAQTRINEKEAEHKSIFVAGWRPFIGWVSGIGLAYQFVGVPFLNWILTLVYQDAAMYPPELDTAVLYNLLLAMLGLGGLRTVEKLRGVARNK